MDTKPKIVRCKKPYVKDPKTKKCTKNPKVIAQVNCRKEKISKVMGEFKKEKLTTRDKPVKTFKQALAIALSQAKKICG